MTFTKGIGSPTYMAPEILRKEHYKKPADIYAFGITMYEVFAWKDAYPKSEFRFPWQIADYVSNGNRPKPISISRQLMRIIEGSWKHQILERLTINDIVALLETETLKSCD